MEENVFRISRPPEPTLLSPHAQVIWMFLQVEREHKEPTAGSFRYAKNVYIEFLTETGADYPDVKDGGRFYLSDHWESDALIRFCKWLLESGRLSKTRYSIYKSVRRVMDFAYALRVIDTVVHHPPVFKGVRETESRNAYDEEAQELINAGLARWMSLGLSVLNGYVATRKGIPYRKKNTLTSILVEGRHITPVEASEAYGLARGIIQGRISKGWTAEEAVGLESRRNKSSGVSRGLVVEGVAYRSIGAAAIAYGLSHEEVGLRLQKGYTPEQAVGIAPTIVLQSDERALLWSFENEYDCDPLAMVDDFRRRKLHIVCSETRFRQLFSRWGVWPFVDDRLIMPLANTLAMLTGLNVESLKLLDIDCYNDEHPLTGQPYLTFTKKRSSSATLPAKQDLHLPLLETEEKFVQADVVQKVKAVINLTLALTEKIRMDAQPQLARRLFIFEDIEATRREESRVVIGIDPKGKTSTWYQRFRKEEGLDDNFGKDFRFNISRCRPTLATNMVLSGATMIHVQSTLGHGSIETTASYLDEHRLQPKFHSEVSGAMDRIVARSVDHRNKQSEPELEDSNEGLEGPDFTETLSGCDCKNPYEPSENVRRVTTHKKGTVCRFWNMCLFCDKAVITEGSLPKVIVYRKRIKIALDTDSPAIRPKRELLESVAELIDGVLKDDVVFPRSVIEEARHKAVSLDDVLVDQLIYNGI